MDEYKEFLYLRRPHYRSIDTLDISPQLAIREKLKCKPFKWFMTEVAFDLEKHYPSVEPPNFGEGEVGTNPGSLRVVCVRFVCIHKELSKYCKSFHMYIVSCATWATTCAWTLTFVIRTRALVWKSASATVELVNR
jgi:hypothetical protein